MEGIYDWVRNIVYYLIFMTIIAKLLPAGKYERYLRLFAGFILILLVIQPLTGGLGLEEKIDTIFRSMSFENEAGELRGELDGMEQKRLDRLIDGYEQSAREELVRMAKEEGLEAAEASVVIENDGSSAEFGKIKKIVLRLKNDQAENIENSQEEDSQENNSHKNNSQEDVQKKIDLNEVEKVSVRVETAASRQNAQPQSLREESDGEKSGEGKSNGKKSIREDGTIRQFHQAVADYYQMEEENVEIRLEGE